MNININSDFPWPLIPGLVGFTITFFVQFRLKNHIDRDKVLAIKNLADLYPNSVPPRKILNERGQRLYFWFYSGIAIFFVSIISAMLIYGHK